MGLAGKFIFHMGEEYSRQGEIIEHVSDDVVLIRFEHSCGMPPSLTAINIKSLAADVEDDYTVEIFNTREGLDAFVEWLDTPRENDTETKAAVVN